MPRPLMSRASTFLGRAMRKKDVDGRDKPGHDEMTATGLGHYRDTCADTASHFPFCFAQQSV